MCISPSYASSVLHTPCQILEITNRTSHTSTQLVLSSIKRYIHTHAIILEINTVGKLPIMLIISILHFKLICHKTALPLQRQLQPILSLGTSVNSTKNEAIIVLKVYQILSTSASVPAVEVNHSEV